MAIQQDNFELVPDIEEPIQKYKIIHIYNRNDVFHLTARVLIDSHIQQTSCGFFYHILSKTTDDFNERYSSFACVVPRGEIEADVYLNVEKHALETIIQYLQMGEFSDIKYLTYLDTLIDLASILGMPSTVKFLRTIKTPSLSLKKKDQS